jgi:superfamily I DNA/RNA helicase
MFLTLRDRGGFIKQAVLRSSRHPRASHRPSRRARARQHAGDDDLFLVGDAHRRIYDSRVSLSSLGIETRGRSRRLESNYRTSQQILGWALGILTGEAIDDLDGATELQAGYRSELQGPAPVVRTFDTASEEAAIVADIVRAWLADGVAPSAIGVVARTHGDTSAVDRALSAAGAQWTELGTGGKGIGVGTMHGSKGLEFARLAVVGVSADRVPLTLAVTAEAEDAQQHALDLQRERCLLYVACTRARDALSVTSVGAGSGLLPGSAL